MPRQQPDPLPFPLLGARICSQVPHRPSCQPEPGTGARSCRVAAPKGQVPRPPSILAAPTQAAGALDLPAPSGPAGNRPSLPQLRPAWRLAPAGSDCLFPFGECCWISPAPKENKDNASSSLASPSHIPLHFFSSLEKSVLPGGGGPKPLHGRERCWEPSLGGAAQLVKREDEGKHPRARKEQWQAGPRGSNPAPGVLTTGHEAERAGESASPDAECQGHGGG